MIAYNAPQHTQIQHCPAAPGHSWSHGTLAVLTDDAVEKWLAAHHPEAARAVRRESRIVLEQQRAELPLERPAGNKPTLAEGTLPGTPIVDMIPAPKHWAAALYPGYGSVEICELVAPLLTPKEAVVLRMQFAEGKTGSEINIGLGLSASKIYGLLKSARVKLYQAMQAGELPLVSEPEEDLEKDLADIARLLQETPTVYQRLSHSRAKRRAYVCDCGHHLTMTSADLDHRKVDRSSAASHGKVIPERLFRCPFCAATYTESEWSKLIA